MYNVPYYYYSIILKRIYIRIIKFYEIMNRDVMSVNFQLYFLHLCGIKKQKHINV